MCVTYNMKGSLFGKGQNKPMKQLDDLFQKDNIYHDIYLLATQEAERSILGSLMNENKDKLIAQLRQYFEMTDQRTTLAQQIISKQKGFSKEVYDQSQEEGAKFMIVETVNLAANSLIMIARRKYAKDIQNIQIKKMPLGIFNKIANKGAISISLRIKRKNFLFLNCHLEAHEENRADRLEQWHQVY